MAAGHGGARVGAGRKPKDAGTRKPAAVVDFAGPKAAKEAESGVSKHPPSDLPTDQQAFWLACAPRAMDQGTLTVDTIASFRLLCELDAEKRATKETIDRDGRTYIKVTIDGAGQEHQELKAHPLTSHYRQTAKQVENLMGRFKLAPFGKAETNSRRKQVQTANPWARVVKQ